MVSPHVVSEHGDGSAKKEEAASAGAAPPSRRPWRTFLLSCFLLFGVASVSYVLGAAVIFFELPSSSFLRRAFVGGAAWHEQNQASPPPPEQQPPITVGRIDKPDKTCDGFTLCLCSGGPRATLINMRGETVHQWYAPFKLIWFDLQPGMRVPLEEEHVYFNHAHLYPNGDLLAVVEGPGNARHLSESYGLIKLDKDSRVLWKYTGSCHHAFDVAEDGTIYALSYDFVKELPHGLEFIPTPCIVDCLDVISPQGKLRKRIRLVEAFMDSPYAALLSTLEKPWLFRDLNPPDSPMPAAQDEMRRRDVLHNNTVKVLSGALAPKFPRFKPGQILISPRHLDALAVLDPAGGKVVWAVQGPWHAQHDPSFLDNGHILLFDNLGSPRGSRVLEYDPRTQAFPWSYPDDDGTPFFCRLRGVTQRLPNGNTLIVNSTEGEMFEVTPDREIVWSCSCGKVVLNRAQRFPPQQLSFLKGDERARP
jgi:hypothetical protein